MKSKRVIKESDEKIVQIRNRTKRRKKVRRISFGIFLLATAVVLTALLTPFFNLKNVVVEGNARLTKDEIFKNSGFYYEQNLFKINKNRAEKQINSLPYVLETSIKRKLPETIKITITERQPVAAFKMGESFMLIDKEGRFLESVKETSLPLIEGVKLKMEAGKFIKDQNEEFITNFENMYSLVENSDIKDRISSYTVDKKNRISFVIDGNKTVVIGDYENIEYKFKMLEAVSNELAPGKKVRIDLSKEGEALCTPLE